MKRGLASFCLAAVTVYGWSGTVTVSATSGEVVGQDTTNGNGGWVPLSNSAQTATIGYAHSLAVSGNSQTGGAPTEFKCVSPDGTFGPRTFNGDQASLSATNQLAAVDVTGQSTFSSGPLTYYQAGWTSSATANGGATASTGTYDPWTVSESDLTNPNGLNLVAGDTASLYYQTSLLMQGTSFNLNPGETGVYGIDSYITKGATRTELFSVVADSQGHITAHFNSVSGFTVYALGANADSPLSSPSDRTSSTNGSLIIRTADDLSRYVQSKIGNGGILSGDLNFGIIDNFTVPTLTGPNTEEFSWHTDTIAGIQSVPEPTSMAALGAGLVALIKRRSGRH